MNWQSKITRTHLFTEEFKRYQGQWYLTLNNSGKTRRFDFDKIFELQSHSKTVSIENQAKKLQNPRSEMALFLKRFLVGLGHVQKLVELMRGQFILKLFFVVSLVYS